MLTALVSTVRISDPKDFVAMMEKKFEPVLVDLEKLCNEKFTLQKMGRPQALSEYGLPYKVIASGAIHLPVEGGLGYAPVQVPITAGGLLGGIAAGLEHLRRTPDDTIIIHRITPVIRVEFSPEKWAEDAYEIRVKLRMRAHTLTVAEFEDGPVMPLVEKDS